MKNNQEFNNYYHSYIEKLFKTQKKLDTNSLNNFINILEDARKGSKRIFFIGNGGSASTASHFVNDLSYGTGSLTPPYNAISLCDNTSILTALSNDYSYNDIFKMQLDNLSSDGDVLVCISASGNSENIIRAVRFAREKQILVVGISAFDGGELLKLSDCSIHVCTDKGEYGISEDVHMMIDHVLTSFIKLNYG